MRIGIDARLAHKEGIGRHAVQLILALSSIDREHEYVVYLSSRSGEPALQILRGRRNVRVVRLLGSPFSPQEQIDLALATQRDSLDLLHTTFDYGVPLWAPCKLLVTIHDAWFGPEVYFRTPWNRWYYQWATLRGIRKARRILTVSRFVKKKILQYCLGIEGLEKKIVVIPNGVGPEFHPSACDRRPRLLESYGVDRYLLYVGVLAKHKNVAGLLEGYARLYRRYPDVPSLVLAGNPHPSLPNLGDLSRHLGIKGKVLFPGYVPDEELPALYRSADLFVFPSLHEGFGIPVLEAMACGTPVVSSNTGGVPEVAGDAALAVDPTQPDEIQSGMANALFDPVLREILRERGMRRAEQFSWANTARMVLDVYRQVHDEN